MQQGRLRYLIVMILIFLGVSFITRIVLMGYSFSEVDTSLIQLVKIFCVGLFYDFVAASYYFIPYALYLFLVPTKIFYKKWHQYFLVFLSFVTTYFILFNGVSEWFFWEEFGKRFNFIAVDYLVYTHEVIHNILESYPIGFLLSAIFIIDLLLWFFIIKKIGFIQRIYSKDIFIDRAKVFIPFFMLPLLFFNFLDKQSLAKISENIYNNELAKDGLYSLFSAFRHNTLEYNIYYKTLPLKEVMQNLENLEGFNDTHLKKVKASRAPQKKYNVMLVMIESMSAEYMGIYGDKRHLTPYLDSLAKQSLFFDNVFATGTRTVRGMEAVTLSLPPTPGRSIVKRPNCHGMYSVGFVFLQQGYENKFIYGGFGYFDNMNDFFSHNGFEVVDRASFSKEEETFGNVWGLCDEDLFHKALKEADKSYAKNKPFFQFIMTTSNHRPYTYPDGKIDIPSHSGREGGVKYTDYAIKEFIEAAKKKKWFKDTIFVIVADHNGGSAGKNTLPLWRYKIPFIVYAPNIIQPQVVHTLASQIDVMPTIMDILGFSYESMFYGRNILDPKFTPRAFIGNYQKLGYFKNNILTVLLPDKSVKSFNVKSLQLRKVQYQDIQNDFQLEKEAITYYQSASYFFDHDINRWEKWHKEK